MKRNGAARTDEFRERFERHRTHSNILRTVDGRRKPQKGPGPDLTEKCPSCVRLSTQKGSLSRGGPEGGPRGASWETREGVHEEVQDEVGQKDAVEKTTPKSDKMWKHKLTIHKQIKNENDSSKSSRGFSHRVLMSMSQIEIHKRTNRRRAPRQGSTKSATKENYELHHETVPNQQGPTDSVSPNHHGHRSRSHNNKSDKVWSNPWTPINAKLESNFWKPRNEKSNPTSEHLKMKILNQPLDTQKWKVWTNVWRPEHQSQDDATTKSVQRLI